ncbi:Zinc/iron permease [Massariosphaeria phaeospora]|uniref:Zinc/iron permease n=1 Tax=Massariosphaeria phaeospora TaxID=100035 RepID=A0A7C8HZM8_9PLEO|nr:Zinc/iron permease [Massariosphaeria phaeospora]
MGLDNDTRGWIMTAVSGIACTAGASIICVDIIIRQFPGKKDFKIEHSNSFLSIGLSLSFGVMIFSSLYSMLPSARNYLEKGGMTPKNATLTLIACFLIGAIGISVVTQVLHRYIPHSVVDCDHEHGDEEEGKANGEHVGHAHDNAAIEEQNRGLPQVDGSQSYSSHGAASDEGAIQFLKRRPSLHTQISTKVSQLVTGSKEYCDKNGQCFGYSDPCGQECFRNVQHVRPPRLHSQSLTNNRVSSRPSGLRTQTTPHERQPLLQHADGLEAALTPTVSGPATMESSQASIPSTNGHPKALKEQRSARSFASESSQSSPSSSASTRSTHSHCRNRNHSAQHHHHVPTNVFLSIGLQTSTAIALHKIPEGFITYATNHANPRLGLSIFLALFIHNITEGFALALPLYLAINSRWKAMFWSALLGGVSQPLGAGVAALWFKIARRTGEDGAGEPGDTAYGALFALTSGIMAMVSLQLLGESLDLTHSRRLCFFSAFAGMGILGLSSALTA